MPSLPFVLPHWLYWGTLIVFPPIAGHGCSYSVSSGMAFRRGPSLFIAYMFWLCSGFMGLHRFYLRSNWGLLFIPVFLLILHHHRCHPRPARRRLTHARRNSRAAASELEHAKSPNGVEGDVVEMAGTPRQSRKPLSQRRHPISRRRKPISTRWYGYSRWLAILMAAMLVVDAILLPGLMRRQKKSARAARARQRAARNCGAGRTGDRHA